MGALNLYAESLSLFLIVNLRLFILTKPVYFDPTNL